MSFFTMINSSMLNIFFHKSFLLFSEWLSQFLIDRTLAEMLFGSSLIHSFTTIVLDPGCNFREKNAIQASSQSCFQCVIVENIHRYLILLRASRWFFFLRSSQSWDLLIHQVLMARLLWYAHRESVSARRATIPVLTEHECVI